MELISIFTESSVVTVGILSPIILAIVELAKSSGLNTRYAGIGSVVLGAVLGAFFIGEEALSTNIFIGIIAGLTASGFYSGVKATVR